MPILPEFFIRKKVIYLTYPMILYHNYLFIQILLNRFRQTNKYMTEEQIDLLSDIDFECAKLEDVLHGDEGDSITHIRTLILKLFKTNVK